MSWRDLTSMVASIATIAAAFMVALTAWIYYRQLQAANKNRELESIMIVLRYIDDLKLRKARYFIYQYKHELRTILGAEASWENRELIDKRVKELSGNEVELHDVDLWLNAMNNICFLLKQDFAPPELISGLMKNTFLHCWHAFHPYIQHRRKRFDDIGEPSMYAQHFEDIVRTRCLTEKSQNKLADYLG